MSEFIIWRSIKNDPPQGEKKVLVYFPEREEGDRTFDEFIEYTKPSDNLASRGALLWSDVAFPFMMDRCSLCGGRTESDFVEDDDGNPLKHISTSCEYCGEIAGS